MKQIKLGLLAVALFGAAVAFAGKSDPEVGWYEDESLQNYYGENPPSQCSVLPTPICAVYFDGTGINGQVNEP